MTQVLAVWASMFPTLADFEAVLAGEYIPQMVHDMHVKAQDTDGF